MGGALGVTPFRGLLLPQRPDGSSPPAYPLDVPPDGCAASFPRKRRRQDPVPHLGRSGPVVARLQGLRLRENRQRPQATVSTPRTVLPLLGFHLLMVSTHARVQGRRPATATLRSRSVRCRISHLLRSAVLRVHERPLSHERSLPSQGSSPPDASSTSTAARHVPMGLTPFGLGDPPPLTGP